MVVASGALPARARLARAHRALDSALSAPLLPEPLRRRALLIRASLGDGKDPAASAAVTELLQRDPDDREALARSALHQLDRGDAVGALADLDRSGGAGLPPAVAARCRARAALAEGHLEQALQAALRAGGQRNLDPAALEVQVRALTALGRRDEADRAQRRLEAVQGRTRAAASQRLRAFEPSSGPKLTVAERCEGLRAIVALDPLQNEAAIRLGKAEAQATEDAGPWLREEIWRAEREPPLLERCDLPENIQEAAKFSLSDEGPSGANQVLDLLDRPDDALARAVICVAVAELDVANERYVRQAQRELDAVLRERPGTVLALILRTFVRIRLGRLVLAERDYRVAAEEAPDSGTLAFYRGLLLAAHQARLQDVVDAMADACRSGYPLLGREFLDRYPEVAPYLARPKGREALEDVFTVGPRRAGRR